MVRSWRGAAVAALAGAAAIAAQFTAITPAQAAAPTISIFATSKFPAVTHEVFVLYHGASGTNAAAIHGRITGAAAGEVAALYGQQFPYKSAPTRLGAITLKSSAPVYSFKVAPTLATHYAVRLFASSTSHAVLATSAVQNVYVTPLGSVSFNYKCPRPQCTLFLHLSEFLPSSALSTEMGKHIYPYFAVNLSPTGTPPLPKVIFLNAGNPVVSGLHKINAGEFGFTLAWTFTIGNDFAQPAAIECQKDSLTKDGLGLPGSHGCGLSKLSTSQLYVG
jgi:hypothetical protein